MNVCMLMMGGNGIRFGADCPKQFVKVRGKPLFVYILNRLNKCDYVDRIVIIVNEDWINYVVKWVENVNADKVFGVVAGGVTRSESVKNGLMKVKEIAEDNDVILIHDATHPYVYQESIKELIDAVNEYGAATMGQRQYDTCYNIDEDDMITKVTPRQFIVSGASPEAFRFKNIYDIYIEATNKELNEMTSAGAIALAHGLRMKVCTLHTLNLKITYPEDMKIFMKAPEIFFD